MGSYDPSERILTSENMMSSHTKLYRWSGVLACIMIAALLTGPAQADYRTIIDIGTLGGDFSLAWSINDVGQIAGYSTTAEGDTQYFVMDIATLAMTDLGITKPGTEPNFWAMGPDVVVGNNGQVVGAGLWDGEGQRGYVWEDGDIDELANLGGVTTRANDINDAGQIVGRSEPASGDTQAFLFNPFDNTMTTLGDLGGGASEAYAVNNNGQVVGNAIPSDSDEQHAFIWDATNGTEDLGTLGGDFSQAFDINDQGQVVGRSTDDADNRHAFIWDADNEMQDLGTIGGDISRLYSINELGQAVGRGTNAAGRAHAIYYDEVLGMIDMNEFIDPALGWELRWARGINEYGDIVGLGSIGDEFHGFVILGDHPTGPQGPDGEVPEPTTLVLMGLGALGVLYRRRQA